MKLCTPICALALVTSLLPTSAAAGLDACFVDSTGAWRGPVWNRDGLQTMDAEFRIDADGKLMGSYHIHDFVALDGTLSGFRQTGDCEAEFTWHDRDGEGTVQIRFEPAIGRFLGHWGDEQPDPGRIFNGYRGGSPRISRDITSQGNEGAG